MITEDPKLAITMSLHYGAYVVLDHFVLDNLVEKCHEVTKKYFDLHPGDRVILSVGLPLGVPGNTNEMRILTID